MKILRALTLLSLALLTLSACTTNYTTSLIERSTSEWGLDKHHQVKRQSLWRLATDAKIAVINAPVFASAPRASQRFQNLLSPEFNRIFPNSILIEAMNTQKLTIDKAFAKGCHFVVVPVLLNVENQLDAWHELQEGRHFHPNKQYGRDTITLRFLVYEAHTAQLVDTVEVMSRAAFFKSDSELPLHLLDSAVQSGVLALASSR